MELLYNNSSPKFITYQNTNWTHLVFTVDFNIRTIKAYANSVDITSQFTLLDAINDFSNGFINELEDDKFIFLNVSSVTITFYQKPKYNKYMVIHYHDNKDILVLMRISLMDLQ